MMQFLKDNGYNPNIIANGEVGPQATLGATAWDHVVEKAPESEINAAITALKDGNFGPEDLNADGAWGPKADIALKEFLAFKG